MISVIMDSWKNPMMHRLSEVQLAIIITSCESGGNSDLKRRAENILKAKRIRKRVSAVRGNVSTLLGVIASIRIF